MDADDLYPQNDTLNSIYKNALEKKALICGGSILFKSGDKIKRGKNENESFCFEKNEWINYSDYQQVYYYQRFLYSRHMLQKNGILFPNYLRFQDPPFFVKAMICAERFYALEEPVYIYRNDAAHVKWTTQKVNDLLRGVLDVIRLSKQNHLDKLYFQMLNRFTNNRYVLGILENSLINGNDHVLNFYREVTNELDRKLLGQKINELDTAYLMTLAQVALKRNMTYHHRPIAFQDAFFDGSIRPSVSVIIPVFNTKEYLSLCLNSIVEQSLSNEIEIICVDDGSTDGSSDILTQFSRKYSNIRIYTQENSGLSAARNTGIQHARGEYLYFMDSDDYLESTAIEHLYKMAKADQLDIVYFAGKSFFDSPEDMLDEKNRFYLSAYQRTAEYPEVLDGKAMLVKQCQNNDYYTSVCLQFFRTQFIRDNGLAFYEDLLHEDNLFSLAAIAVAQRVRCINDVYFHRRVRHASIMSNSLSYKNLLGYYLTAIEEVRMFHDMPMSQIEREVLCSKVQAMLKFHVCSKWPKLSQIERVLFLASLRSEDRMLFESFVLPMIECKTEKREKSILNSALVQQNTGIGKKLKSIVKLIVPKFLHPWLRKQSLRIPHRIKVVIKKLVHW